MKTTTPKIMKIAGVSLTSHAPVALTLLQLGVLSAAQKFRVVTMCLNVICKK